MNNNDGKLTDKKQQKALDKQQKKLERQNKPHPLRYKKAGERLTRAEVAEIKAAKKKLKADVKAAGITNKDDIKILEVAKGAYFDDPKLAKPFIKLFGRGGAVVALLISLIAVLAAIWGLSEITKMKGHFSVNLTPEMYKEGFSVSETLDKDGHVAKPTSYLKGDELDKADPISIAWIGKDVDGVDGSHNGKGYFAYTFYIENTGEIPASYEYVLRINSQSKNVRKATWVMLFEDGKMRFFADATKDGDNQTLPERNDNTQGYRNPPFKDKAKFEDKQFELIPNDKNDKEYYRLIAFPFESDNVVTSGVVDDVQPGEVHKYTVVLWLEGDDPDCTDELIGGHLGMELNFEYVK